MFSVVVSMAACSGTTSPSSSLSPASAGSAPGPSSGPAASGGGSSETTASGAASGAGPPSPVPVQGSPTSVEALMTVLLPTEEAIHSPLIPLASLPALGAVEQRQLGTLSDHPEWMGPVLGALPPGLRAGVQAIVEADRDLGGVPGPTPTAIPAWQILRPQPAASLLADYQKASAATGVPWQVLAAIHLVESRMGRIRGPSGAGAQGPMQFLPATWAEYGAGGDINNDADAISAAARFLRANGAPGDLFGAIYHYNRSTSYVRAILAYDSAMSDDARAFDAFYGWQVYVHTTAGTFLLPEGYGAGLAAG